jgi:integrase
LQGINTRESNKPVMQVNMKEWRSIDYRGRLEKELNLLRRSPISETNKKLILRYKNWRLANSVSIARTHREVISLRLLCEKFDVELDKIDENSLLGILAEIETENWKLTTKNEYKKDLKLFLRMIGREDLASMIKCKEPRDNNLTRDDLLAVDEVLKITSVSMNSRDPALIMCHLDLSCRPEELLTLTVGDFIRDSWGIKVEMRRSKTFRRSPHLSFSIPYVSRWLEAHPFKDDPEAPMWVDLNKLKKGIAVPINNDTYTRIINRLLKRAGITRKKRFTPYNFRHTGITMWSVILTEQQLSKRSGHVLGSAHLRRYAKLVDADTDKKILKELGLLDEENSKPEVKKLTPVKCSLCGEKAVVDVSVELDVYEDIEMGC